MAKIKLRVTEPPVKDVELVASNSPTKTILNDKVEARDILSMMAGGGHTNMQDPEVQKHFIRLSQITGAPLAQKLATQALLFNTRPEAQKMNPEQRVSGFFDLGSNDPEVSEYLQRGKSLGYGPLHGFRNSPLVGNRLLTGKGIGGGSGNAATADKIKLLVKNKTK